VSINAEEEVDCCCWLAGTPFEVRTTIGVLTGKARREGLHFSSISLLLLDLHPISRRREEATAREVFG